MSSKAWTSTKAKQGPNHKHQISNKDQTEKHQIPNGEGSVSFMNALPAGRQPPYPGKGRLELGFLVFGPCLLFGACSLVLLAAYLFRIC
jgi:hypothetical protein